MIPTELSAQFYHRYQTTFRKNRVQYNDFFWTFYRFKNFDTYFYVGGKELAQFVGKNADKEIQDVELLFDFKTIGRLQFIIFNRYDDDTKALDLYVTHRKGRSWTPAVPAKKVNGEKWELNPALSPDGQLFFYEKQGIMYYISTSAVL